jgi:hypothetical protein
MRNQAARIALVGLLLVGFVATVSLAKRWDFQEEPFMALGTTPAYQAFAGALSGAIFTNTTGQAATGLLVMFSSAVPSASGYAIAGDVTLVSNENRVVQFDGDIPSYGAVYVQWEEDGVQVLDAQWVVADGPNVPVDLHQPLAGLSGTVTETFAGFFDGATISGLIVVSGHLSTAFDGSDIVRYVWEWDDGLVQEGMAVERTYELAYSYLDFEESYTAGTVTLTVWTSRGASASATCVIRIHPLPAV